MRGDNLEINIADTLSRLRRKKGLTQQDVADKLSIYGYNLSKKSIYNWEKGLAQPNIEIFFILCEIYGVDDIWWTFTREHKGPYAGLNDIGRHKAKDLIDLIFHIEMYRDEPDFKDEDKRFLPLYTVKVSAGTGNYLDESDYNMIEVPPYVDPCADFALKIIGDSMQPLYKDQQIIWIKNTQTLDDGEIGIFSYDNNAFCKKLIYGKKSLILRSINKNYEDIIVNDNLEFRIIGKVVS